jgi:hypothetical protein
MRTLKPCGTPSAYKRHLYNNEEPCDLCRAANTQRAINAPTGNSTSREVLKLEEAMAERPPVIEYRLGRGPRGGLIQIAVRVDDPYMEHGPSPRRHVAQRRYYEQKRASS